MDFTGLLPPEILGEIIKMVAKLEPPRPAKNELSKVLLGDEKDHILDLEDGRIIEGVEDPILKGELGGFIRCSHVCRYWRSTAIGLMAHSNEELGVPPEAVPTLAQRLGEKRDIRIALYGSFRRRDIREAIDYMAITPSFATRIVSLGIFEHRRNALERVWTKKLQDCQLAGLHTLTVVGNEAEENAEGDPKDFAPLILPELRRVILCDSVFAFPASPHLTYLRLEARLPEFDWLNPCTLYLSKFLPAVALCKNSLEVLWLCFPVYDPFRLGLQMAPDERIHFPRLRKFDFEISEPQPDPGDDDFNHFPPVFGHLLFDAHVMRNLTAVIFYLDIESLGSMPASVEAVNEAGFPPVFGLRVLTSLNPERPMVFFSFYASPSNLALLHGHKDILDATFGVRDRDLWEEREMIDMGEDGQSGSDRGQDTKKGDEGNQMGGGRGPLPMFHFEASYDEEIVSLPSMIAAALDGLPIGALKVHYADVENWETVHDAVEEIVPDDVHFGWLTVAVEEKKAYF